MRAVCRNKPIYLIFHRWNIRLLLTCNDSCCYMLSAAQDLHRQVRVITLRRQDIDHPVLAGYPESHYLKSLWLQMLD